MKRNKTSHMEEMDFDLIPDAVEVPEHLRPAIFSYSRAEALADGTLRDVSEMAREAGLRYPVALTLAAWQAVVEVPQYVLCETEEGRLWDLLNVLMWAAKGVAGSEIEFSFMVADEFARLNEIELRAICGPSDDGSPAVTVLLRNES